MYRRGFSIIELLIVISIMGVLLTLAVVNMRGAQVNARDAERKNDIASIQAYLESFYNTGSLDSQITNVTNIVADPKGVNTSTGLFAPYGGMTKTTGISWNGINNWYRYVWSNTASNNLSRHLIDLSQLTNGEVYTISFLAGNSGPSAITGSSDFVDASGASIALQPGEIKRISYSSSRATYDSTYRFVDLNVDDGAGADGMLITDLMVIRSDTLYNFSYGDSPNWSWNGTINNSTSFGPPISTTPGTYPALVLASESLIATHVPDANIKSFTSPSDSSPTESFIPATNNIQTVAGVTPQPSTGQYVYQPINSNGQLCHAYDCRKFNLFYRLEADNTVYMVTSKNQ